MKICRLMIVKCFESNGGDFIVNGNDGLKERLHEQESFGQAGGDEGNVEGDQKEENCRSRV